MINNGGGENIKDLLCFIHGKYDGENRLIDGYEVMWNQIIIFGEEHIYTGKKILRYSRNSSTKLLLKVYIENDGQNRWEWRRRAMREVWMDIISALIHLDQGYKYP